MKAGHLPNNPISPYHSGSDPSILLGGYWDLSLTLPPNYPNSPPSVHFITPCCHPNVNFKTGEICLDLLKTSWTPAYTIVSTLEAVQQLMSAGGEPDSPLNLDIARLMREGDLVGAEGLVRFYTGLYAIRR
jgi:peroxin-4